MGRATSAGVFEGRIDSLMTKVITIGRLEIADSTTAITEHIVKTAELNGAVPPHIVDAGFIGEAIPLKCLYFGH